MPRKQTKPPKSTRENDAYIGFKLPAALKAAAAVFADKRDRSLGYYMREALRAQVERDRAG